MIYKLTKQKLVDGVVAIHTPAKVTICTTKQEQINAIYEYILRKDIKK